MAGKYVRTMSEEGLWFFGPQGLLFGEVYLLSLKKFRTNF